MARRSRGRPTVIYAAIGANVAVAVTKFVVAALSSSASMLSEAFHSTVDTADQLLLLLGEHRSARPPDEQHPYGHGKELYFWSLIVAIAIFALGGGLSAYEGVQRLLHPRPLRGPGWVYAVIAVSLVFEASSWMVALRELAKKKGDRSFWRAVKDSKDPAVYTVLAEDSTAIVGLLLAFSGVLLTQITHNPVFDGLASIGIGALLGAISLFLAYETRSLLVGESDPDVARTVRRLAAAEPTMMRVGAPLTMQLGPDELLVNVGVQFREGLDAEEVVRAIDDLERALRREHPQVTRVFVEAEPLRRGPARSP